MTILIACLMFLPGSFAGGPQCFTVEFSARSACDTARVAMEKNVKSGNVVFSGCFAKGDPT